MEGRVPAERGGHETQASDDKAIALLGALEGRLVLSVVPGLPTVAVVPAVGHSQSAAAGGEVQRNKRLPSPASARIGRVMRFGQSTSVSYVAGSWVVPTVSTKTNGYSSVWVGIDGYSSSTVEQIGTEEDVVNGKATYYAWYEMYPSAP